MRGDEAKNACPQIHLVQVPVARNKADLSIYRNAGSEVVAIISQRGRCERASIDENPPEKLEAIDEEVLKSHVLGRNENGNKKRENVREWIYSSNTNHKEIKTSIENKDLSSKQELGKL
ncbi:hypothetical protein IFM89_003677 [Coptis chinensis]|uniref:DNA polymerase eta n=1 Tax=Coptis chinensis TaxID=261450 RepID=A0A835IR96_9MAGN|nr:hypothetical protein IFM89_003677 [Coptis chinensis]